MKFPLQIFPNVPRRAATAIAFGKTLMFFAAITAAGLPPLLLPAPVAAAAEIRTRTVDMQKILLQSDAGKKAKEQLAYKAAKYEAEKNVKEDALKKLKAELEKQSVLLSESARSAKEKDYQTRLKEYQRFLKDAQDDLQAENDKLTNKIVEEVLTVLQSYGQTKGFSFIMVKNESMLYMDESMDVTAEVLDYFNRSR